MESLKKYIYQQLAKQQLSNTEAAQLLKELHTAQTEGRAEAEKSPDIAIIGMAGRFAGADDLEEFWQSLRDGRDFVRELPGPRRENVQQYLEFNGLDTDDVIFRAGSYLEEIDTFDYRFFKISAREASLMDPNQRLFLETAWQAIEDAGYGGAGLAGSQTGIFVGYSHDFGDSYKQLVKQYSPDLLAMATLGNINSVIFGRLAYLLDLRGPAMLIDTACSSALVAIHQACQSIRSDDCRLAIAGGVKAWLVPAEPKTGGEFGGDSGPGIGIEAQDGRSRTFDHGSTGAGFGEGVGAIVLKPLDQALKDRDAIYAVIKGGAVNQDGLSIGLSAPNMSAQEAVLQTAWKNAQVRPETISYIEAHGTGTKLGDPIEIQAIQNAFAKYTQQKQFCGVGAVKSNVGHLDHAAGMVGLAKLALSLHHKELPPTIHFQQPNRQIDFIDSPVYVNTRLQPWDVQTEPRRAGISAFGLSGTNCHLILEESPQVEGATQVELDVNLFTLSAVTLGSLQRLIQKYVAFLKQGEPISLTNLCFTANTGRGHYQHRLALLVRDRQELFERLSELQGTDFTHFAQRQGVYYNLVAEKNSSRYQGRFAADKATLLDLMELAKEYVGGAKIDWADFYQGMSVGRVHLPVYQFAATPCWVEPNPAFRVKVEQRSEEEHFFQKKWQMDRPQVQPLQLREPRGSIDGTVLIFTGQHGLGDQLVQELAAQGIEVVQVRVGESFAKLDDRQYRVRPDEEGYRRLFAELKGVRFAKVIHLLSLDQQTRISNLAQLEEQQEQGVLSLFHLVRVLAEQERSEQVELILVTDYANQVTSAEKMLKPENALILGLGKVINQEFSQLVCRGIDLDGETSSSDLLRELWVTEPPYLVAYRKGERYLERLEKYQQPRQLAELPLKEEGVYLITGGLGGIGLELGRHLAGGYRGRLALVSRRGLPPREKWEQMLSDGAQGQVAQRIQAVISMEEQGAEVLSYAADVADLAGMQAVLADLKERFGRIDGVIHTAGVAGDGLVVSRTLEEFRQVLRPKVQGTWVLDYLTRDEKLDFMVFFSSVSAIFGGPGQGDYTAANSYLDAFAAFRSAQGQPTISINWTGWQETGMAVEHVVDFSQSIFKPISTQAGLEFFEKALQLNQGNLLVGEINHPQMAKVRARLPITLSEELVNQGADQQTGTVDLAEKVQNAEERLIPIWKRIFGVEQLTLDDTFNELGGDSIIALTLVTEMNKEFADLLGVADLYTYPTVRKLAEYLRSKVTPAPQKVTEVDGEDDADLMLLLDKLERGELSSDQGIELLNKLEA